MNRSSLNGIASRAPADAARASNETRMPVWHRCVRCRASAPSKRTGYVGRCVDLKPFDLGGRGGAQPRVWSAETGANELHAASPWQRRDREVSDVTASGTPPRGKDFRCPRPAPVGEEVGERPAGEEPAASCKVEQREHGVRSCRKQQPDGEQRSLRIRAEDLEVVTDLDPLPIIETEVRDDALLMAGVARRRRSLVAQCRRDGVRVAPAPRRGCGRREQPGRLPASRERNETATGRQRRLEDVVDGLVQRNARAHDAGEAGGRRCPTWSRTRSRAASTRLDCRSPSKRARGVASPRS